MAIKKLSFKGDDGSQQPRKKRKRTEDAVTVTAAAPARTEPAETTWVDAETEADLSGPVVLASLPDREGGRTTVAADARGSVFSLPLARDGLPDDVRQVFVCVPHGDRVSLKGGASGKYLSSDAVGEVTCLREAIGPQEAWSLVRRPDGWALQNDDNGLFLGRSEVEEEGLTTTGLGKDVRCDAEDISDLETFAVRIQSQNKKQTPTTGGAAKVLPASKKELENKVGRPLTLAQVEDLRAAQRAGELSEAILDMRVRHRSDKYG